MSWYDNYLTVFEKPFADVPTAVVKGVREKLKWMQSDTPIASVVVIAHNEETRLLGSLWSLADNRCRYPVEVIGVNNGSTDRTGELFHATGVPCFFEERKSPGYARACGQEHARGKYCICIDGDTLYPPHYIETMIRELEKPGVMAVSSLWSFVPDKSHSRWGLMLYEAIRDLYIRALFIKRPERGVRGVVFAYRTEYGRKVGYRVELIRGEDGSMALGLMNYGRIKLITSRKARAVTAGNTLHADGSLFNSFKVRMIKGLKNINFLFTRQTTPPEDEESNLITNRK
jgi:glycosyltransferase involved in cell wall biosynthesis